MTDRQFEALKPRVLGLVDDPQERRKLLLQALAADTARANQELSRLQGAIERSARRSQRLRFLLDSVVELMPEIQKPDEVPLGQLVALIEPTHPDLAQQLREVVGL